jgi:anaerobic ribonucleoside-triphosphate reductase activating protein
MDEIINIAGTVTDSIVDGPGIRYSIFAQGCAHNCLGCHNPHTHEFGIGKNVSVSELFSDIQKNPLVRGVTFSGGDPFYQSKGFAQLAQLLHQQKYEVACYTGFTWEHLVALGSTEQQKLLSNLDILVDGPFLIMERNLDLLFRGSENQRIIDVPASLQALAKQNGTELNPTGFRKTPVPSPILCTAKRWVG